MTKTNFVYITTPTKEEAKKIALVLLEKGVIACANILPMTSVYRWEGEITGDDEYVLILKTFDRLYDQVQKEVEAIHSYSVPCIAKVPVDFNEKYFEWLAKEIEA